MFTLSLLPYDLADLEPQLSKKTLEFHYGKHHQTYVDNLNKLITGSDLENDTLDNIIIKTSSNPEKIGIFNNAAQVYNHNFFWASLLPVAKAKEISPRLLTLISESFNSLDNFYVEFKAACLAQFGSGWVWLVKDGKKLKIMKTANADTPIAHGLKPLFGLDVWEHAYYLDYQNRRADYVEAILKNLINWEFVENNL